MKKTVFLGLLVIILAFGFIGCDNDNKDEIEESDWWTWVSQEKEDDKPIATTNISIIPSKNNTEVDVTVTGTPNPQFKDWATQLMYGYTAVVGKKYRVSWKWKANNKPFNKVTIRKAQAKDYEDREEHFFEKDLTIPTTEESKTYEFTMLDNCFSTLTFFVGGDTGSFKIYDFEFIEVK